MACLKLEFMNSVFCNTDLSTDITVPPNCDWAAWDPALTAMSMHNRKKQVFINRVPNLRGLGEFLF